MVDVDIYVINDEEYNKPSINVESHYNSKTIFYIKLFCRQVFSWSPISTHYVHSFT